jgi:glycosyltransferase involved in cell wall biosynthesis
VVANLKAADLFCFASITETQGLVTMEAMAAGLPVVAVDATGTSDVVEHGHDGLLTENDSDALAQAIEKMLNNAEMRARFKEASLKRAQSLSIEAMAQRLIGVYHQAIEDRKAGRRVQVQRPGKKKRWYEILDLNF